MIRTKFMFAASAVLLMTSVSFQEEKQSLNSSAALLAVREAAIGQVFSILSVRQAQAANEIKYTCPMHPHYIADEPGTCPICGMDLVALDSSDGAPVDDTKAGVTERTSILIAPETIQNMGVRTARAEQARFGRTVRSFGLIKENIRDETVVSGRVGGWIEELNVTAVGDAVEVGMVLYRLFSPDLISAQQDYLVALASGAGGRVRASEQRLRSLGVQEPAFAQIKRRNQPLEKVPFYAQAGGIISELNIRVGTYVAPGMLVARIQDYSTVWLMASVAEKDLAFLRKETPARVTLPNLPDRRLESRIDYIYPTIDPASRTGQVRIVIDNADGLLRPGAYADVEFAVGVVPRLAVPNEAILKSKAGSHVVVALGSGRFQPRTVRTGLSSGGWTEISEGLEPGSEVVVSGQFLIDSESALRESFRKLEQVKRPLAMIELDHNQLEMIDHMIDSALYVYEAVTDGYDIDAAYLQPARDMQASLRPAFGETRLGLILKKADAAIAALQIAQTDSQIFEGLHALVTAVQPWITEGKPNRYNEKGLALFEDKESHRRWIQVGERALNPYGTGAGNRIEYPATSGTIASRNSSASVTDGAGHVH